MLVLTRRLQEVVIIRNRVTAETMKVVILRIGPNATRIGFEAPDDYEIVREEIADTPADA